LPATSNGGAATVARVVVVDAVEFGMVVELGSEVVVVDAGAASSPLQATANALAAPARKTRRETGLGMAGRYYVSA